MVDGSRTMIRAIAILQIPMLAAIIAFGYWRRLRAGRFTYLGTCLIWFLLILDVLAFSLYSMSLPHPERDQWANWFPDGTHVLFLLFAGIVYAFVIGPITALVRRRRRGEKNKPQNDQADAQTFGEPTGSPPTP